MQEVIVTYKQTRQRTEALCKPLKTEDYIPQATMFVSPPKWHLAHTSWFFEEMILKEFFPNYQIFDESYSYLFNSYYNSLGERIERGNRGLISRPTVDEVYAFRRYVDEHMMKLGDKLSDPEIAALITLGINHEQQHQELLVTDLKHTFSYNPTYPIYNDKNFLPYKNKNHGWLGIDEGIYEIGHQGDNFSYDNELGRHRVFLENFEISRALVTNGEFMEFMEDGGYTEPRYWLDDGWHWLHQQNLTKPLYWKKINNEWYQYTLSGMQKVDKDRVLTHISFYEASAYAFWAGRRLPTEFEWEIAAPQLDWGEVWEWTNSAYLPYPNFEIAKGAAGEYNGKFMINTMVLRGSSLATAENHSRITYRNFFAPTAQWQFTGIRLVK